MVGSKERAINGARALALASGKTHFVQIEIPRESTRHIWITAQDAAAAIKSANSAAAASRISHQWRRWLITSLLIVADIRQLPLAQMNNPRRVGSLA